MNVVELTCLRCGRNYRPEDANMVCEDCGSEGLLDVGYDHDGIARVCDRDRLTRVADGQGSHVPRSGPKPGPRP